MAKYNLIHSVIYISNSQALRSNALDYYVIHFNNIIQL